MSSSPFTRSSPLVTVFDLTLLDARPGLLVFRVIGKKAHEIFEHESGGHRWQRVPPTEKRGRVHTSTVTVAVLPVAEPTAVDLGDKDLEWLTVRGSGPGGQHRNKTESCVVLRHRPSGLSVRCDAERSQHRNRAIALQILRLRLQSAAADRESCGRNGQRRTQIGSGMRGDKIRTVRMQDGIVTDHVQGRRWKLADYLRGAW